MRLFVAIDIPDAVRAALEAFQRLLRPTAKLSWSAVANLHITTKFIGEWPEDRIADVTLALGTVPVAGPIEIRVKGIGWFPNERRPRVFWAGVEGGEALRALARDTGQAVAALGVPAEGRPYSPHLTLARIRETVPHETVPLEALQEKLRMLPAGCGYDFGVFRATRFFLYLSRGGKYTQLAGFPLE
ncbi:MAG: RNA 2',3'-cyclic phosphodiesterase [Bryobacterales bacterium]|nr:RNA 2',3'-cyclic phosphodiesterase [Bryobacterales bacterium]